jgi:hypothetical protein
VFAELERSILKDRRPRSPVRIEAAIAKALQQGKHGIHKITAKHSVGVGVVQRIKAAL